MSAIKSALRATIVALAFLWSTSAPAFNDPGHFYTAYALASTLAPGPEQKSQLLVAFCAQLPDMASDIDAVGVYSTAITSSPLAWARWGVSDATDSSDIAKMVTVQHLLHALTGGNPAAVQALAKANANGLRAAIASADPSKRSAALCAFGFALHFFGDSYAHQVMDDPRHMYATGRGHAADLHYPDYILCSELGDWPRVLHHCKYVPEKRFAAWSGIWSGASDVYDPVGYKNANSAHRKELIELVQSFGPSGSDWNNWNEDRIRAALGETTQKKDFAAFIEDHKSTQSCASVVKDALATLPALRDFSDLDCREVWKLYSAAIRKQFEGAPADARAKLDRPFKDIYVESVLDP